MQRRDRGGSLDSATIDLILLALDWTRRALQSEEVTLDPTLAAQLLAAVSAPDPGGRLEGALPVPAGQKLSLRLPANILHRALDAGTDLKLLQFDLGEQRQSSLTEIRSACARLAEFGRLLCCRIDLDALIDDGSNLSRTLPAYMLFEGNGSLESGLRAAGLRRVRVRRLQARKKAPSDESPPGDSASVVSSEGRGERSAEFLRIPVELADRLVNLAGAAVGARNELNLQVAQIKDSRLQLVSNRLGQLVTNLQEEIMRTRLQAVRGLFRRIPRIVRDMCRSSGKQIRLQFSGEEVELDKNMSDAIGEALLHLVRNCVDHGVENPAARRQAGKPETATIRVCAAVQNGAVTLEVSDDGRGLDYQAIRQAAVQRNLVAVQAAASLSDAEVADLIFAPGLSTAARITETSGRGVGMDSVRNTFQRVGGAIQVNSESGKGLRFKATLPQTLSIVTCIVVGVGEQRLAVPQAAIDELVRFDPARLSMAGAQPVYRLRDHLIALVDLGEFCYNKPLLAEPGERFILVANETQRRFGLVVAALGNPEEVLVRPLGVHFDGIGIFSGAAVLGDESVTPVVDLEGIARDARLQLGADRSIVENAKAVTQATARSDSLVFEDNGQLFAIPAQAAPRIEPSGARPRQYVLGRECIEYGGQMARVLRPASLAGAAVTDDPAFLILLRNDSGCLALAADRILGVQPLPAALQQVEIDRRCYSGQTILHGRAIVVLNVQTLISDSTVMEAGGGGRVSA